MKYIHLFITCLLFLLGQGVLYPLSAETIIDFSGKVESGQDITSIVKEAIQNAPKENATFIFPKGTYHFSPEHAFKRKCNITNHENGDKNIAFLFVNFKNVKIEGNGAELIFTGPMLPFLFINSQNIQLTDCSIDWSIPFYVQGEVIQSRSELNNYDIRLDRKGYDYRIENNQLVYPNQKGFTYQSIGESLVFDKQTKSPIYHANLHDIHRKNGVKVYEQSNGTLRMEEKIKNYPPVGSIIVFKGPNGENRYAPAIHALQSKNIRLEHVNVYHALGMGFLGELSENISLKKFNVKLREGSTRMVSATADATHFCNCRGKVYIDNCVFENMLDDGTNVHGTYVRIEKILSSNTLRTRLMHFQQAGFKFARPGDKSWFLIAPTPQRVAENTIVKYNPIDEFTIDITFAKKLPENLKAGDLIENKTWNTDSFTMRNCTIRHHRARNIVLKTPGKTLIENNYFQSMMASILMRAEASFWYESGANENIVIRKNTFENCTTGGGEQALLFISPRLNKDFDTSYHVDKNIVFEKNTINTFDNKIIYASSVDRFIIKDNMINQTNDFNAFNPNHPLIDLYQCKDILIRGNKCSFNASPLLRMDKSTEKNAKVYSKQ